MSIWQRQSHVKPTVAGNNFRYNVTTSHPVLSTVLIRDDLVRRELQLLIGQTEWVTVKNGELF